MTVITAGNDWTWKNLFPPGSISPESSANDFFERQILCIPARLHGSDVDWSEGIPDLNMAMVTPSATRYVFVSD